MKMLPEARILSLKIKKKLVWLLLLLSALSMNCGVNSNNQPNAATGEQIHKNGLTVNLPANLSAKQSDNGFTIEPADGSSKNIRIPIKINVELFSGENGVFPGKGLSKNKTIAHRTIKYQIDGEEGGSGGEIYNFTGYESTAKGYVKYSQSLQSEIGRPDFATLWQIIGNTAIK